MELIMVLGFIVIIAALLYVKHDGDKQHADTATLLNRCATALEHSQPFLERQAMFQFRACRALERHALGRDAVKCPQCDQMATVDFDWRLDEHTMTIDDGKRVVMCKGSGEAVR